MLRPNWNRASTVRLLAALFLTATVAVSACAANCFAQHCAAPPATASEHTGHAGAPSKENSHSGDCATHGHPGNYIKDRASISFALQTDAATAVAAPTTSPLMCGALPVSPAGRDHTPGAALLPLYEFDCALRI